MSARLQNIHNYNSTYDLVRGVAAFSIFFHHLLYPINIEIFGMTGLLTQPFAIIAVEFFFALSGVLLGPIVYDILKKKNVKHNLSIFLKRRWLRTLPTYYLGFIAWLIITNNYLMLSDYNIGYPDNLIAYPFFLQGIVGFDNRFYRESWSLAIEELFYLLLPLISISLVFLIKDFKKQYLWANIILIAIAFSFRQASLTSSLEDWQMHFHQSSLLRLDAIAAGALISVYVRKVSSGVFILSLFFICASLLFYSVAAPSDILSPPAMLLLHGVLTISPWMCGAIILYVGENFNIRKKNRFISFFADISYPMYVFHMPIMLLCAPFIATLTPYVMARILLSSVITVFICWGIFRFFETPFLRIRPNYKK